MHNNILKAIKSYYNQKNTDYAILLNGCWGTGKTFFVENTLKKDAIIDKNCKVISISASGINDVDSFIKNIYLRIALEKLPSYKKRKKIYKKRSAKNKGFSYPLFHGSSLFRSVFPVFSHFGNFLFSE